MLTGATSGVREQGQRGDWVGEVMVLPRIALVQVGEDLPRAPSDRCGRTGRSARAFDEHVRLRRIQQSITVAMRIDQLGKTNVVGADRDRGPEGRFWIDTVRLSGHG